MFSDDDRVPAALPEKMSLFSKGSVVSVDLVQGLLVLCLRRAMSAIDAESGRGRQK
ncbi:hypothetical protein [Dechloromonas denitrificans]|uniref:hypothetical protein n=1 Tax=Dechloromonas denitrificans TaxID=281362 RepID=UPI001CF80F0A|nr:hypothetical protein [Dechloromonas denitrificans]UCV04904.1 hypothetical protein KI611_06495 [Dechloromonas denitrificans]